MSIPFTPAGTVTVAATAASASAALPNADTQHTVRIVSDAGGSLAFIKFGDASVVATVNDTPVMPGAIELFRKSAAQTHIAAITASGTATIYATTGDGA